MSDSPIQEVISFLTRKMLKFEHGVAFDLQLSLFSNDTNAFSIIGMTREGIFKFNVIPAATGNEETFTFRIPDIPTFVTVFTTSGLVERGDLWGTLFLRANGERILKLASGYISKQSGLNWPITQSESELAGGGNFKTVLSTDPAAGANASYTVPDNEHWIFHCMRIRLVTDATVTNRRMHLSLPFGGGSDMLQAFPLVDQAASATYDYYFGNFGTIMDELDDNKVLVNIPANFHINGGTSILTAVLNLQAGDNMSAMYMGIEQYFQD